MSWPLPAVVRSDLNLSSARMKSEPICGVLTLRFFPTCIRGEDHRVPELLRDDSRSGNPMENFGAEQPMEIELLLKTSVFEQCFSTVGS
jgi:hypothetical protein